VDECQTTGVIGENIISHCQSPENQNETSIVDSWYSQEQWKQLNCKADRRYLCMMQREGERQSLDLGPVKYHGKWPFLRVFVFQVSLLLAWSRLKLTIFFVTIFGNTSIKLFFLRNLFQRYYLLSTY
jgi:post-GPI attachment to proteins factor 3